MGDTATDLSRWVYDNDVEQYEILYIYVKHQAAPTCLQHNNFERSVKETQIRLWCYCQVGYKSFCDTVAKNVRMRMHFPRRLKDPLEEAIHESLCGSGQQGSLLDMMKESKGLADRRQRLETSRSKPGESLNVLTALKNRRESIDV